MSSTRDELDTEVISHWAIFMVSPQLSLAHKALLMLDVLRRLTSRILLRSQLIRRARLAALKASASVSKMIYVFVLSCAIEWQWP